MNKQGKNGIPYCDFTWNPVVGCLHGCSYCFAERIAKRFNGSKAFPNGFAPTFHEKRLTEPMKIKKPSRIFVSDMGDLFGDWVPDEWINDVLMMVQGCSRHTFLFLTKNPKRYREFEFPENAWIGTSVENQAAADERIPLLLQAPAKVRFISAEPLLGPVDLSPWLGISRYEEGAAWARDTGADLDWVIVGGESGPCARPTHPDWVRGLRDQCQAAGTKFFFKQWGEWIPDGPGCGGPMSWQSNFMSPKHGPNPNWNPEFDGKPLHIYEGGKGEGSIRVGKKQSGRFLDGRTWDEMPEIGGVENS